MGKIDLISKNIYRLCMFIYQIILNSTVKLSKKIDQCFTSKSFINRIRSNSFWNREETIKKNSPLKVIFNHFPSIRFRFLLILSTAIKQMLRKQQKGWKKRDFISFIHNKLTVSFLLVYLCRFLSLAFKWTLIFDVVNIAKRIFFLFFFIPFNMVIQEGKNTWELWNFFLIISIYIDLMMIEWQ